MTDLHTYSKVSVLVNSTSTNFCDPIVTRFSQEEDVLQESTRKTHYYQLIKFFAFLNMINKRFDQISKQDIIQYRQFLIDAGSSASTQRNYLIVVKRFYKWCNDEGICNVDAKEVKLPPRSQKHVKEHLTPAQARTLLDSLVDKPRDYCICSLMLRCGLRTAELASIKLEDIQFRQGQRVLYVRGKGRTDKHDYVVLTSKAYKSIQDYLQACRPCYYPGSALFVSQSDRSKGKQLSCSTIRHMVKNALREIGLDRTTITTHSLRHSFGTMALTNGASLYDVQLALRHKSPVTTEIYLESIKEDMRLANPAEAVLDNLF